MELLKAKCIPKVAEDNGVIAFVEYTIFRAIALKGAKELGFQTNPFYPNICLTGLIRPRSRLSDILSLAQHFYYS